MINIWIVLVIIFFHWIADFVFQSDKEAQGKSKNWKDLLSHTIMYSLLWGIPIIIGKMCGLFGAQMLLFIPITFCIHTATDFYTSRVNRQLWEQKDTHGFFVSIGFDQFLHYVQLLLTFYFLKG